ncbi:hypothetical protein [Pseudoalteromonas luteoviolacea]|uniref:Uncharacterized protein n=1 Tax=Pseudoalteromonas luteoviolacea S4054 TaxID=1129367 RepID=A0A0F6AFW2_9GAMM|nr:hypothetical protein [Pseudoalteromonas luteoviolacea]AOT08204.1 hypothetical protein S4054249_10265 [Pseudoalteromonas luteoviolacea]AOT13121.1 hypothetical protein S40542_10265 [Pseudoalteromonas luteoviolacea]AOT18033.1 hypothetical protein S4054_10260 [Pseudoalteromonas luteoviolacea]KKE84691.1 hypothetical protein N479_07805 [Pseudoalteromonas luteoviolacea S4054]KZN74428.1 hypothetical protein N481_00845 [Pseudoalteromonas luteoviolacea S4047-1]
MLTRIIGYVLFVPFILFYSYVLGPALKVVLIPGGLMLFVLILGPDEFSKHWRSAFEKPVNDLKPVQSRHAG